MLARLVCCWTFTRLPFLPPLSLLLRTQGPHISSSSQKRAETWPGTDRRYLLWRLWLVGLSCDLCHLQGTQPCGQASPRSRNCPDLLAARHYQYSAKTIARSLSIHSRTTSAFSFLSSALSSS